MEPARPTGREVETTGRSRARRLRLPRFAISGLLTAALAITPATIVAAGASAVEPTPTATATAPASPAPEAPPTEAPSTAPTAETTVEPTAEPTVEPTVQPTPEPAAEPEPATTAPAEPTPSASRAADAGVAALAEVGPHSISGVVTRAGGAPVTSADQVRVTLYERDTDAQIAQALTDDGVYALEELPSGEFYLEFASGSGTLLREFYADAATAFYAQTFAFADDAPQTLTGIDAALAAAGTISGTVTNGDGSSPAGTSVSASVDAGSYWSSVGYGSVLADGTYTIAGLPVGDYRIDFDPQSTAVMGEYYDDVYDPSAATLVSIATEGQAIVGIDAELEAGSSISGTVSLSDGGDVPAGTTANAQPVDSDGFSRQAPVAADGTYTLEGLAPGAYVIAYNAPVETNLINAYYGGADWQSATRVTIATGAAQDLTGYDVQLALGSQLSGTVTRADGQPWAAGELPSVFLETLDNSGSSGSSIMDASGAYVFHGIAPGEYRVKFEGAWTDDTVGFVWYDDVIDPAQAQVFTFTEPTSITGIDGVLSEATTVSGTVTKSNGAPLAQNEVQVQLLVPGTNYVAAYAQPRADGTYRIENVVPRDYIVRFNGSDTVRTEYYDDARYEYEAQVLTVGSAPVTGIDAELVAGTTVSGTITRADGEPIGASQLAVYAYDANYSSLASAWVDADGEYTLGPVPAGTVKVSAVPQGTQNPLVGEWYDDATSFDTATPLTVSTALTPITDLDLELAVGTTATGTVTGPDGEPLSGVFVSYNGVSNGQYKSGTTDADGEYTVYGIGDGEYTVSFSGSGTLLSEYWEDAREVEDATEITVAGEPVSGIDAQLEQGNTVAGTVTVPAGVSLADCAVQVTLLDAVPDPNGGGSGGGGWCVEADGTYSIEGVAPGEYVVSFFGEGLANQYFDGSATREGAEVLEFVEGEPVDLTGIDADLVVGGTISGSVTRADGGSLTSVTLDVVDQSTGDVLHTRVVGDYAASYTVYGLPLDTYLLRFSAPGLPTQYYGGSLDEAGATPVTLGSGSADATGIDMVLVEAAPDAIVPVAGGGQTVTEGQSLNPLMAIVEDGSGEAAYGAAVVFELDGPATFPGGASTYTSVSNAGGYVFTPSAVTTGPGEVIASARLADDATITVAYDPSTVNEAGTPTDLEVSGSTTTTLVGGQARLSVTVTNDGPDPVTIKIATMFGSRTFTNVASGTSVTRLFNTYRPTLYAGTATVTVTDPATGASADFPFDYESVGQ